ncbi:unnamed protein product [Arabidopsis lyrata]|nr:unnamed protein product [Arabidopsis lyrata]
MCPPDTPVTEWQHVVLSPEKKVLVFETVQQPHDVPFGSYFEVHCRWRLEAKDETSSVIDIRVGVHFKKWCLMQSKIKAGAIGEYKKDVEVMLEVALSYLKSHSSSSSLGDIEKSALSIISNTRKHTLKPNLPKSKSFSKFHSPASQLKIIQRHYSSSFILLKCICGKGN